MPRISILTDSTANLPPDIIDLYHIPVIPLKICWNGETFLDGVDMTPSAFYTRLEQREDVPTTSQPSIQDFTRAFERLAPDHDGIVVPLISSGISGTVASAQAAASQFTRVPVQVIDTHSTSTGLALVVLAAARAADAGKNFDKVVEIAQGATNNLCSFFAADDLKYLHRGGRIGGAARYLGSALSVKPILYFNNQGKIDALERVRTQGKALERMVELVAGTVNGSPTHIGVTHANNLEKAELLKGKLIQCVDCQEVHIFELSPVIGAHIGPGTVGVAAYSEP